MLAEGQAHRSTEQIRELRNTTHTNVQICQLIFEKGVKQFNGGIEPFQQMMLQ